MMALELLSISASKLSHTNLIYYSLLHPFLPSIGEASAVR